MTEGILLSNADFDSSSVMKRTRETGAYLFRFSDEAEVLIRLFVMKFSIADISHRGAETQRRRGMNGGLAWMSVAFSLFPSISLSLRLCGSVALWLCG